MRNFTAVFLVLILCAGISSGQEADTSNPTEETLQVQETAPMVAKTTECQDKKWIIGFEATSLDLRDLPGTVFLQRKISPKFFVGAGLSFFYDYDVPGEDYDAEDSSRYNHESKKWTIHLSPEIGYMALNARDFTGGLSVKASLRRMHAYSYNEYRHETQNYMYSTSMNENDQFDYGIAVPVFLEKQFRIKKYQVAVGMVNNFLTVNSGWYKYHSKQTYESAWSPILDVNEDESTRTLPVYFNLYNPFQGYVRIYFKVYL